MVVIRDVPWSVPVEELRAALNLQGIAVGEMERWRQHVRVEVSREVYQYRGCTRPFTSSLVCANAADVININYCKVCVVDKERNAGGASDQRGLGVLRRGSFPGGRGA